MENKHHQGSQGNGRANNNLHRLGRWQKKLVEYNIDDMEIKKPKKWDGKWRIISFDIPKNKKQPEKR